MSGLHLEPGWLSLIGGVILLIAEIIAPGFFLIFIGAAAIAAGLFTLLFGLGTVPQLALFAVYAILAVLIGKRFYAAYPSSSPIPFLNDPAKRLVGKVVTVTVAVDDHQGRVRVGDSEWSARGGPAEVGDRVRITNVEGNCLIVEPDRQLSHA
jgi:membrane protein implicated in regulation of membrane protease activity